MSQPLIEVSQLRKTYRQGFWMRKVEAVRGISFAVPDGDVFGFLGPNGAGKTTTIKVLTGLIRATSGTATLFGGAVDDANVRRQLGFLPENPYVYPYLTPREFVRLSGQLSGLRGTALRDRVEAVLTRVGMAYAADRAVRRLSKGMLQRTGLAAALVADPQLLILDEPMSGLDPVGRKEVRDLILDERANGRTIFFSTHILTDVETMCDRVAILRRGRVVVSGKLRELLNRSVQLTELMLRSGSEGFERVCGAEHVEVHKSDQGWRMNIEGEARLQRLLSAALADDLTVVSVIPRHETLEALFVRKAIDAGSSSSAAEPEQRE